MNARTAAFAVAGAVALLDRLTKLVIRASVSLWDQIPVIPGFFAIVHTENRGAAFGAFAESGSAWRDVALIGLAVGVMAALASLLWQNGRGVGDNPRARLGYALILGGAAGNVYDRIVQGAVTDFLEFNLGFTIFPAFNVADSAITIGAALLLLDLWRGRAAAPQGAASK